MHSLRDGRLTQQSVIKVAVIVSQQVRPLACKKALAAVLETLMLGPDEAETSRNRFDQMFCQAVAPCPRFPLCLRQKKLADHSSYKPDLHAKLMCHKIQ